MKPCTPWAWATGVWTVTGSVRMFGPPAGIGEHDVDEVARMLVMVAGVPLRFAVTSPGYAAAAGLVPDDLAAALALLHDVQRKLP